MSLRRRNDKEKDDEVPRMVRRDSSKRSMWVQQQQGEEASSISSITRLLEESTLSSVQSDTRSSGSTPSELHFSKRLSSDLSDEVQKQNLKPAKFFETRRKSEKVLPVSKLRFSSLKLIGRDEEKQIMEDCLNRVAATDGEDGGSREFVLISGEAGTGKTALAHDLKRSVKTKLSGFFVKGKFDLYLRDEPYSGIAAACREVCGHILHLRDSQTFEKVRNELLDNLGSENIVLLNNIIPELLEVLGDEIVMENYGKVQQQGTEETKARFNYAFRIFFRVVASFSPLVVLLDDLQWSDAATLDLLQVLITDCDNPSLMVIGIYRSNEVDETHLLSRLVRQLKSDNSTKDFNLTEIEIGNLDIAQTNQIVMSLLSMDDIEETRGLADVCQKRSHGNPFSLLVFLEMLREEGLLTYNIGQFKWIWDEAQILAETAATANVVDMMKVKMQKLPIAVRRRLSVAACLGFSFELAVLDTVWCTVCRQWDTDTQISSSSSGNDSESSEWVVLVEKEGFLELEQNGTSYRWVHDKVQEAATSLVPFNDLPSLMRKVGEILVAELDANELDSYIFTVVNLLHEGDVPENELEQVKLANLSLQASQKACGFSAFESADKYAELGLNVLPNNKWSQQHYRLTLDLYSTAAEVAGYLGKTEQLKTYFHQVLDQKERPVEDKLRVYHAMISYLMGALGRPNDAIELLVNILAQFGFKFPKRKGSRLVSSVVGAIRAKRTIASLNLQDIENMPTMKDSAHLETMRLLDQLFVAAYLSGSDLVALPVFASARLTLKHGISLYSGPTFACLACLLCGALGDLQIASKAGKFAQVALKRAECRHMDARAVMFLYGFVFCWTEPLASMTTPLLRGYETGLLVGDNENACWSIAQYIVISFQCGKPLGTVEADCVIYSKQMKEFKREIVYADICIYIETCKNLMGQCSADPTVLERDEEFVSHSNPTVLNVYYSCQCVLYLYFGEFEKGAALAIERGDTYPKEIPGHVWIMIETFARGMCLYAMARKTRKRKYTKQAKKVHKTIKAWVQKGNPNVKHYDLLFNAEFAALRGKLDAAEGWYQSATVSAVRQGRVHESALACERYGDFLLHERNDREEARHKIQDAIRRYTEWGAEGKVDALRHKHQDLWETPTEISLTTESRISKLGASIPVSLFASRDKEVARVSQCSNDASQGS